MRRSEISLIREQLQRSLTTLEPLKTFTRPTKGWIRAIRDALGMTGRQLAQRMHVQTARIAELEQAEISGNVTMSSLRRAAEAMDCELVYAFMPRKNLDEIMRRRAIESVKAALQQANHSMLLENQALDPKENLQVFRSRVEELIKLPPRGFWDLP